MVTNDAKLLWDADSYGCSSETVDGIEYISRQYMGRDVM